MTRYEYHIEFVSDNQLRKQLLNQFGVKGWELCGTVSSLTGPDNMTSNWPGVTQLIFKRPLKANKL